VRGELPAVAAARMAEIRSSGTWGSSLTTAEFAAVRSAGAPRAVPVCGDDVIWPALPGRMRVQRRQRATPGTCVLGPDAPGPALGRDYRTRWKAPRTMASNPSVAAGDRAAAGLLSIATTT
jgi:hypothetical protein